MFDTNLIPFNNLMEPMWDQITLFQFKNIPKVKVHN